MKVSLTDAIKLILNGDVVAIPTETVFGLAASIFKESGIKKIFELKNRPADNPLIVHISSLDQIKGFVAQSILEEIHPLIKNFWPGALTLLLPLKKDSSISTKITANLPNIAVRMPNHPITLKLIDQTGPLVAPSANLSTLPSGTLFHHIENDFGSDFPILDGEILCNGIESTILAKEDGVWKIAREGLLTPSNLKEILGYLPPLLEKKHKPICPGQMYKHYSPKATIYLRSYDETRKNEEVTVGYIEREYENAKRLIYLGSLKNPSSLRKNLYATLRLLDEEQINHAVIDFDIPDDENFRIIKERLKKAAALC